MAGLFAALSDLARDHDEALYEVGNVGGDAAQSVDRREKNMPELAAKYEKTREYRSSVAKKGLKTKQKNAEQKAAGDAQGQQQPGTPATP